MVRSKLFRHTFWLLFLIGVLNISATYLYLYWTSGWFDLLMHFLGGFWVSMLVLSVWNIFNKNSILSFGKTFVWVIIIGILWEVFEMFIGAAEIKDGYVFVFDTVTDMAMDIVGGIAGFIYGVRVLRSPNK